MSGRVQIIVTEDALYVANTGRPITRQGVISIARQYLSSKGETPPDDMFDCEDSQLIGEIRSKRLRLYREEPNDLKEHASQEVQTRRDYVGRALWELLQNADDAMAPSGSPSSELIGAKGLGFKSVLEITDRPEIYSGAFHFGFDPDRSHALLSEITEDPPRLVFRLPHDVQPDRQVKQLKKAGFATVVKLPFKDHSSRQLTENRLKELPPFFIILCQHLTSYEVSFRDKEVSKIVRLGGELGQDASRVTLDVTNQHGKSRQEWRLWSRIWAPPTKGSKRLSAAIAIRVDGKVGIPTSDELPIHVFYPTQEFIEAPFLVHASFELRSDRNHLLAGPHDGLLLETLGELASHVCKFLTPKSALKLFASFASPPPANVTRMDRRVQRTIGLAVHRTAFIPIVGGGMVTPPEARIWAHSLPTVIKPKSQFVRNQKLASAELADDFPLLRQFGSNDLKAIDYAQLLAHANCKDRESCLRAAHVAKHGCLSGFMTATSVINALAKAPFWLTSDQKIRALSSDQPLVLRKPERWPNWLAADELDGAFAKKLFGNSGPSAAPWGSLTKGKLLESIDDVLVHSLVPKLVTWSERDWSQRGLEALGIIFTWRPGLEWSKIRPLAMNANAEVDPVRQALAGVCKVPVGKKWVPSIDAYASADIKGDSGLAQYFKKNTDSPIVGRAPKASSLGREGWRSLLRYLGVSWEPKIRAFSSSYPWQGHDELDCFYRYRSAMTISGLNWRERDWYLDEFPDCVANSNARSIADMLSAIFPVSSSLVASYKKRSDAIKTHRPTPFESCVDYQLRREAYLPCRVGLHGSSGREVPSELFWPTKGLPGITSTVDLGTYPKSQRERLQVLYVRHLGVKDKLPTIWRPWLDWASELAEAVEGHETDISERLVREFYEAFLQITFALPKPSTPKRVVCNTTDGLKSVAPSDAIWIDDARLASRDILSCLLNAGASIFPPMLARGEGSVARFGVRRASEVVGIAPTFAEELPAKAARLAKRLKVRRRALAAVCERKHERWIDPPPIVAVHGLKLTFSFDDAVVATRSAPAFRRERDWLINLDGDPYEALATACSASFKNGPDLRFWFAALLRAGSKAEIIEILTEGGIPAYRLQEITVDVEEARHEDERPPDQPAEGTQPTTDVGDELADIVEDDISEATADDDSSQVSQARALPTTLRKRPLYDPDRTQSRSGARSSGRMLASESAKRARERGYLAEAWFAECLRDTLPGKWFPSFNVRDDEARESDVVLSGPEGQWHIELKSLATTRVYWSELEQQKALEHGERYFMAFLVQDGANGFRIYWSWNPLVDLNSRNRRIEWLWAAAEPGPPLEPQSWEPLEGLRRPTRKADRLNFVIEMEQSFLRKLSEDDRSLKLLWQRIRP